MPRRGQSAPGQRRRQPEAARLDRMEMPIRHRSQLAAQPRGVKVVDVAGLPVEQIEHVEIERQLRTGAPAEAGIGQSRGPGTLRAVLDQIARAEMAQLE